MIERDSKVVHPGPPSAPMLNDKCTTSTHISNDNESDQKSPDSPRSEEDAETPVDHVFEKILETIGRLEERRLSQESLASSNNQSIHEENIRISDDYTSVPYGFQPRDAYDHRKENTEIMGVEYNGRMREFIILDARGILTWSRSLTNNKVTRALTYPKYEYRLITTIIYARKYNCYFALGKDFSLKMLNKDFVETLSINADLQSVLFMLFNPVTDELITGGVGGTKVWRFHQVASNFKELKSMANYRLTLKSELNQVGGSWVKRVELDQHLQHLYCCSDTGLFAYDLRGNLLFQFNRAHSMSITACKYSVGSRYLITSSLDTEVKVWSLMGGLVHTFRGHSRAVTDVLIHPESSFLFLTSSLDGTVRLWSLDTMEVIYSLLVSVDGVIWMGLTDDKQLYLSTVHTITIWSLNTFYSFWGLTRSKVHRLGLVQAEGKTTRVMAVGEDSSVRLFARSTQKNISTVLPPPSLSPMESVLSVGYNRTYNVIYLLMSPTEIWLYTTRTDPACRAAVWNITEIQKVNIKRRARGNLDKSDNFFTTPNKGSLVHRTSLNGTGSDLIAECHCLCVLASSAMLWTDEGMASPLQNNFLLLGTEDGRLLFMDPVVKNLKHMELKVSKDKVLDIFHNQSENCLLTQCQLKDYISVQIWSLPQLQLKHELYITPDLSFVTICGPVLFTGHSDGAVLEHRLIPTQDYGLYSTKAIPSLEELERVSRRPDHSGPIIALDSCPQLNIVCSCSSDGVIKIWGVGKVLLTEIYLGEPSSLNVISSACFLNNRGDLVVSHLNHVFCINHTKVCPSYTVEDLKSGYFDKESTVLEDPRVLYDDSRDDAELIDLQKYLVPFDIEFSKDFLEGQEKLEALDLDEHGEVETETEKAESEISNAPTEIYFSPPPSPCNPSMVDLLLGSEVTEFDLRKQWSKTCRQLTRKGRRRSTRPSIKTSTRNLVSLEMPEFGTSPGPSPAPSESSVSTPRTRSSISISELEAETSDDEKTAESPAGPIKSKPIKVPDATTTTTKPSPASKPETTRKTKYGLAHIRLSNVSVRKVEPRVSSDEISSSNHSHVRKLSATPKPPSLSKPRRELKKKAPTVRRVRGKSKTRKSPSPDSTIRVPASTDLSCPSPVSPGKGEIISENQLSRGTTPDGFPETSDPSYHNHELSASRDDVSTITDHGIPKLSLPDDDGVSIDGGSQRTVTTVPPYLQSPAQGPSVVPEDTGQSLSSLPMKPPIINVVLPVCENDTDTISLQESGSKYDIDTISVGLQENDMEFSKAPPSTPEGWADNSRQRKPQRDSSLLSAQEKSRLRQRPASSYAGVAHMTAKLQGEQDLPPRPHTAVEDDQDDPDNVSNLNGGKTAVNDLQDLFYSALRQYRCKSGTLDNSSYWLKNSGNVFEENWQDRMIQRHQLLQLQKHVRAKSASHRRRLLEQRQTEKRHCLIGHHHCDPTHAGELRPDSSLAVLDRLEMANNMCWVKSRSSLTRNHRPNTRSKAALQNNLEKQQMGMEKPFRLRMNKSLTDTTRPVLIEDVDLRSVDPRNPTANRPHSSKSIPSKCSNYILIERPGDEDISVASPLEEQLLLQRFPNDYLPLYSHDCDRMALPSYLQDNVSYVPFVQQIS